MRNKIILLVVLSLSTAVAGLGQRKPLQGRICGNPNAKCNTSPEFFSPNDIRFEVPKNSLISQSEAFYAVILKSDKINDIFGDETDCKAVDTEEDRLAAQSLFPNNKVFSQRCGYDSLYYTGVQENTVFLAVYAGKTLAQAQNFLKNVDATGKFKGAYIKKLRAEFNGT